MSVDNDRELIYVADPMCSWCWGFAPVIARVRAEYQSAVKISLVIGGLRPGPAARRLDDEMRRYLRAAWQSVHERSGQAFSFDLLERDDFLYDTDPAANALVAMRRLEEARELDLFGAVQEAFYVRNDDVTQFTVLAELAVGLGVDGAQFSALFSDRVTRTLVDQDYRRTRELGVNGFPTLLLREDSRYTVISHGYQPYSRVDSVLRERLC